MQVIGEQVLMLFVFVVAGFLLSKFRIVNADHSKVLSSLLVYVFLPSNIFKTFSNNFTPDYLRANSGILLTSVLMLAGIMVFAHLVALLFAKEKYERYIYAYSMIIPNYGYMGYALAEALLGESALMMIMTFGLPFSLYIYTVGFAKLTKRGLNPKKLINPVIVATALGIVTGLSGLTVPPFITGILQKSASCMAPVSMLLTGIVISGFSFRTLLSKKSIYPAALVRLVVLPLLAGGILHLTGHHELRNIVVLFCALPCGLNTVIFPKLVDENCETGAGLALVCTTLCCVTLPLILTLFGIGG